MPSIRIHAAPRAHAGLRVWLRWGTLLLLLAAVTTGCGNGGGIVGYASNTSTVNGIGNLVVHLLYSQSTVAAHKRVASAAATAIPVDAASFVIHVVDANGQDVVPPTTATREIGVNRQNVTIAGLPPGAFTVLVMMFNDAGQSLGFAARQAVVVGTSTADVVVAGAASLISVVVSPSTASIAVGATQAFTAIASFSDGSSSPITALAIWASTSQSVATVSSAGVATAGVAGTTNINATWQGQSGSAAITVGSGPSPSATPFWGAISNVSTTGASVDGLCIKVSADGTMATATWTYDDGSSRSVQTASAVISGNVATWGTVTTLSAPGQSGLSTQIALSSDGTKALAAWERSNGSVLVCQAACATISGNTATWGTVQDVSDTGADAYSPQVAMSSDGSMAIMGWENTATSNNVATVCAATISGTTATWGTAAALSVDSVRCNNVRLAMSADGTKLTAMWAIAQGVTPFLQTVSGTIPANTNTVTWGSVTDLTGHPVSGYGYSFALSADGSRATAVWTNGDSSSLYVESKSATISGSTQTWGDPTTLSAVGVSGAHPQVALSSDGTKATVVWYYTTDYTTVVPQSASAVISGNAATWSAAVNLKNTDSLGEVKICMSSDGSRVMAVWSCWDGFHGKNQFAWGTTVAGTTTWSAAADLGAPQTYDEGQLAIGMSADGVMSTAIWSLVEAGGEVGKTASAAPSGTVQSASYLWP